MTEQPEKYTITVTTQSGDIDIDVTSMMTISQVLGQLDNQGDRLFMGEVELSDLSSTLLYNDICECSHLYLYKDHSYKCMCSISCNGEIGGGAITNDKNNLLIGLYNGNIENLDVQEMEFRQFFKSRLDGCVPYVGKADVLVNHNHAMFLVELPILYDMDKCEVVPLYRGPGVSEAGQVKCIGTFGSGSFIYGNFEGCVYIINPHDLSTWCPSTGTLTDNMVISNRFEELSSITSIEGRWIVAGTITGYVSIWDLQAEEDENPCDLKLHSEKINAVTCTRCKSSGHHLVVSGSDDGIIVVFDIEEITKKVVFHCRQAIYSIAMMEDGRIASGGDNGDIMIWELHDKEQWFTPEVFVAHDDAINCILALENNIITLSCDNTVCIWSQ